MPTTFSFEEAAEPKSFSYEEAMGQDVVRSAPTGSLSPQDLLPAVRKMGGEIVVGEPGDTHPDIISDNNIAAADLDQRGFSGPLGFMDRESAAAALNAPTAFEPGRLHSTDLSVLQEPGGFEKQLQRAAEGEAAQPLLKVPSVSPEFEKIAYGPTRALYGEKFTGVYKAINDSLVEAAKSVPEFLSTEEGLLSVLASMTPLGRIGVEGYFTYDMLRGIIEQAKADVKDWDSLSAPDKAGRITKSLAAAGLTGLLVAAGIRSVKGAVKAPGTLLGQPAPAPVLPVTEPPAERPGGAPPAAPAEVKAEVGEVPKAAPTEPAIATPIAPEPERQAPRVEPTPPPAAPAEPVIAKAKEVSQTAEPLVELAEDRIEEISAEEMRDLAKKAGKDIGSKTPEGMWVKIGDKEFLFINKDLSPTKKAEVKAHELEHRQVQAAIERNDPRLKAAEEIVKHVRENPAADPNLANLIKALGKGYRDSQIAKELLADGWLKLSEAENDLADIRNGVHANNAGLIVKRMLEKRAKERAVRRPHPAPAEPARPSLEQQAQESMKKSEEEYFRRQAEKGRKPKATLAQVVEERGRQGVEELLDEWTQGAELSEDGKTIRAPLDPRESDKLTKVPAREFLLWLEDRPAEPAPAPAPKAPEPAAPSEGPSKFIPKEFLADRDFLTQERERILQDIDDWRSGKHATPGQPAVSENYAGRMRDAVRVLDERLKEVNSLLKKLGPAATEPAAKEPSQMSRQEILEGGFSAKLRAPRWMLRGIEYDDISQGLGRTRVLKKNIDEHKRIVKQALAEGKPVPPEVLADYPDLKPAALAAEAPKAPAAGGKAPDVMAAMAARRPTEKAAGIRWDIRNQRVSGLKAKELYRQVGSNEAVIEINGHRFLIDNISRLKAAGIETDYTQRKTTPPSVKTLGDWNKYVAKYPKLGAEDFGAAGVEKVAGEGVTRLKPPAPAAPQTAAAKVETAAPELPSVEFEHPREGSPEAKSILDRVEAAQKESDLIYEEKRKTEAAIASSKSGTKKQEALEVKLQKLRERDWDHSAKNKELRAQSREMYLEHLVQSGHISQKWAALGELLSLRAQKLQNEFQAVRERIERGEDVPKSEREQADAKYWKAKEVGEQARAVKDKAFQWMKDEAARQLREAGATPEEAEFESGQSANMQVSYPGMKTMQEIPSRMRAIEGARAKTRIEAEAKALKQEFGVAADTAFDRRVSNALPNEERAREIIQETRRQYESDRKAAEAKEKAAEDKAKEQQKANIEQARKLQAQGTLQWVRKGEGKGVWYPVSGKPVTLKAVPDGKFFVYHAGVSRWSVTEATTGFMIGEGKTRGEAIANAEARISERGVDQFRQVLAKAQKEAPPIPSLTTTPPPPSPGMAGPGTPSATQASDVPGSQLAQLTQTIRQQSLSPKEPLRERIAKALSIADRWAAGKDAVTRGIGHVRAASSALLDAYLHLPEWRDFQTAVGRWTGADQATAFEVRNFRKTINAAVPNKLRQEAITNWIQADGNEAILRERAAASRGRIRRGYETALELNDAEKTLARNVSSYLDARLQEGIDAGLLKQGVDNYITQIWKRPTTTTNRMWADLFGLGKLNPTFRFARKRIFDSYFEGEQAGFVPRSKNVGDLIAAYDLAFNRALSARGLIRELHEGTARDGNPIVMISGSGVPVPKDQPVPEAFLIKPKTRPKGAVTEDGRPYVPLDHWALRDWKWVAKTPEGQNIFVQGDMLVHPDHYQALKNSLKGSLLRQNPVSRALLHTGGLAKQTKLSLSPFHTVQEGLHAMAHRVDPTGVVKSMATLDLNHPEQRALVDHGLMIADPNAAELFAEGLSGGGLIGKIPGLGRLQQWYTEKTFQDFIPRLKMTMALDALERNRKAYAKDIASGKVTDDQILAMTARQSNAAFGEQNYRMMGRSPTVQDFLRLSLLAPDFLEARFRFVAQALKPYGREQRIALALMGATIFVTSRIINKAVDDDYHWDKPFSVFFNGREYHLRTLLGDVQHLLTDPRSFWYNRMSPITRTMSEYVTGRDDRGIKRNSAEQFVDFLKWFQPIPLQRRPGETVVQQALAASGVPSKLASKQQEIYEMAEKWMARQDDPKIKAAYDRRRQETRAPSPYTELRQALRMNELGTATRLYTELLRGRKAENIRQAFNWNRPVTGSRATERLFLASLDPSQRSIYNQAVAERKLLYDRFMQVYMKNISRPTVPQRVLDAVTVKP